jgi:hypothetical protein
MMDLLRLGWNAASARMRSERHGQRNGLLRRNIQFTIPRALRETNVIGGLHPKMPTIFAQNLYDIFSIAFNDLCGSRESFSPR